MAAISIAPMVMAKDVRASSVWWASAFARRAGDEGVGAHRAGDDGVGTRRSGDEGAIVELATKMAAISNTLVRVGGCQS